MKRSITAAATLAGFLALLPHGAVRADESAFKAGLAAYEAANFGGAAEIWRPLADAGDAKAAFRLGHLMMDGKGVAKNRDAALDLWRTAADADLVEAQHALALALISDAGAEAMAPQEALHWLVRAAEAGSTPSQYTLGKMYLEGLGTPKDYEIAYRWMGEAAEAGFPPALYNIAKMSRDGLGVPPDNDIAFKLFSRAAEAGHGKAQAALAVRYQLGEGVQRDPERALFWAYRAQMNGVKRAEETITPMVAELGEDEAKRIQEQAAKTSK